MSLFRSTLVVFWAAFFAAGLCALPDQLHAQRSGVSVHARKRLIGRFGPRSNSVKVRVAVPRAAYGHKQYALPQFVGPRVPVVGSRYPGAITAYDSQYRKQPVKQLTPAPRINPSLYRRSGVNPKRKIEFPIVHTLAPAKELQLNAEKAFRSGQYQESVKLAESAMRIDPRNGLLKLFASQANFATGRYRIAATELEAATNLIGPEEWGFFGDNFQRFYGRDDYVRQTRALVEHVERRPDDYQAKVLLGYHYGIAGHRTSATELFHRALRLNPQDGLAQRLIPAIGDPSLPISRSNPIQAPSPEVTSTWIRNNKYGSSRTPPKRIYLTSQFETVPSPVEQVEQPMSYDELIEAPADVFVPQLDGPSSNDEIRSVLEDWSDIAHPTWVAWSFFLFHPLALFVFILLDVPVDTALAEAGFGQHLTHFWNCPKPPLVCEGAFHLAAVGELETDVEFGVVIDRVIAVLGPVIVKTLLPLFHSAFVGLPFGQALATAHHVHNHDALLLEV